MEVDIKKYDILNQTMTQEKGNKNLLTLRVRNAHSVHVLFSIIAMEAMWCNLFSLLHLYDVKPSLRAVVLWKLAGLLWA